MVSLEGEGVAYGAPGLRRKAVESEEFVCEEGELNVIFKVPEDGGVDLHVLELRWGALPEGGEVLFSFGVGSLFVESTTNLGKDPWRFALREGDGIEDL